MIGTCVELAVELKYGNLGHLSIFGESTLKIFQMPGKD
jgi:hypothetical protein